MDRLFLLGIDGATFDLLLPWCRDGYLPNFSRILNEGCAAPLTSTNPPITPTAWTSCFTGVNPEYHTIFDFLTPYSEDPPFTVVNSTDVSVPFLWEIPGFTEKRTILVNVPYTYPPTPLHGICVSGLPVAPDSEDYCYPREYKGIIEKILNQSRLNLDIAEFDVESRRDAHRFLDAIDSMFEARCQVIQYLLEKERWEIFIAVFVFLDRVQHLFWKILDPQRSAEFPGQYHCDIRERVLETTQRLDQFIGIILEHLSGGDTLIIVSDHGFGGTDYWINYNWLFNREGLLHLVPGAAQKSRRFYRAMKMEESPFIREIIPQHLRSAIRRIIRRRRSTYSNTLKDIINWNTTQAFFCSIPSQGIYLNLATGRHQGAVQPGLEYIRTRDRIMKSLDSAFTTLPEKIEPEYWFKSDREGTRVNLAPDIHLRLQNFRYLGRPLLGSNRFCDDVRRAPIGFHRLEGIFCAWGDKIRKGVVLNNPHILQIAPTLFQILDLPIPRHFQGKPLHSILRETATPQTIDVDLDRKRTRLHFDDQTEDKIISGLRQQGYF